MCCIKTVGFTSALWVIYARCNDSLVVCSSMQASRFQIPGSPVQKKARDEGSGHGSPLGSPRAFPGSANFTIRVCLFQFIYESRFTFIAKSWLRINQRKKVSSIINLAFMFHVFTSFTRIVRFFFFFFFSEWWSWTIIAPSIHLLSPIFLADSDFLVDLIITLLEARLRRGARKAHSIFPGAGITLCNFMRKLRETQRRGSLARLW